MNKKLAYLYRACFVFCGGHFEFLRGLLVRSLEPKLRKFGTGGKIRKFSEVADRLPRMIKRQGMKLLTSFRRMSLLVGGNGNKMWKRDRKSKLRVSWRAFKVLQHGGSNGVHFVLSKRRLLQIFFKNYWAGRRCRGSDMWKNQHWVDKQI